MSLGKLARRFLIGVMIAMLGVTAVNALFVQEDVILIVNQSDYVSDAYYGQEDFEVGVFWLEPIYDDIALEEMVYSCQAGGDALPELELRKNHYVELEDEEQMETIVVDRAPAVANADGGFDYTFNLNHFTLEEESYTEFAVYGDVEEVGDSIRGNYRDRFACGIADHSSIEAESHSTGNSLGKRNMRGNLGYASWPIRFRYLDFGFDLNDEEIYPGDRFEGVAYLYDEEVENIDNIGLMIDYGSENGAAGKFIWRAENNSFSQYDGWGGERVTLLTEESYVQENERYGNLEVHFVFQANRELFTGMHEFFGYANYGDTGWPEWTKLETFFVRVDEEQSEEIEYGNVRVELSDDPVVIGQEVTTTFYVTVPSCSYVHRLDFRNNYLTQGRGTHGSFYAGVSEKGIEYDGLYENSWGGDRVELVSTEFEYDEANSECAISFTWVPQDDFLIVDDNTVYYYMRYRDPYSHDLVVSPAWTHAPEATFETVESQPVEENGVEVDGFKLDADDEEIEVDSINIVF